MSEIETYFTDLQRDIKSKPEVASVRIGTANRKHQGFEERTFEVFIKSAHQDTVQQIAHEIGRTLQVETEVVDSTTSNHHIEITSTFDANTV